jgi:hypothetical protein
VRAGLTANDTPWIFGFSPGLNDPAQLTFLANAGPGVRWDIIECQVAADAVAQQANRQVFDEVLQVFNPQLVNKVQASAFTFRIRRGVQGAGIPDIDANWMPLAAVHVRTDATSFADSDLFDIRPLTTDRCEWGTRHPFGAPVGAAVVRTPLYEAEFTPQASAGVNGRRLRGYYRSHFAGYWSGGQIRRNDPSPSLALFNDTTAPGASFNGFNFETATVRSGAFALVADTVITLGAFFPRGYPRWVRYSQASLPANDTTRLRQAGRYPQGPRGILVVLNGPDGGGNIHKNGIIEPTVLPVHFGETTGAWGQVVCYAAVGTAGTDVYPPSGSSVDQKYIWPTRSVTNAPGPNFTLLVNIDPGAFTDDALANPASEHSQVATISAGGPGIPKTAAGVLLELQVVHSILTAKALTESQLRADIGGVVVTLAYSTRQMRNDSGGTLNLLETHDVWVPLRGNDNYDAIAAAGSTLLALRFLVPGAGYNANPVSSLRVQGYQL